LPREPRRRGFLELGRSALGNQIKVALLAERSR